jgi:hypothetical protein
MLELMGWLLLCFTQPPKRLILMVVLHPPDGPSPEMTHPIKREG